MNNAMTTTFRNTDLDILMGVAAVLKDQGFAVSPIVIIENEWEHGAHYFHTNASNFAILCAVREVR